MDQKIIHFPTVRKELRNKNIGQSLFKKHSKFQNFDEIFYCGMTRLRNTNLDVFIQCQYTMLILENFPGVTVSVKYFNAS